MPIEERRRHRELEQARRERAQRQRRTREWVKANLHLYLRELTRVPKKNWSVEKSC